jgi:16S rRNA (guanine1516-N2)-methyltransferase
VSRIGIAFDPEQPDLRVKAEALGADLGLPIMGIDGSDSDDLLVVTPRRLELRCAGAIQAGPVYVDFLAGGMRRRQRELGSSRQLIARAVGFKGTALTVVDATAGLGRDAFLLACLGCRVTAIERCPSIWALLADGMDRAAADPDAGPIVRERIRLVWGDARAYLSSLSVADRPDVTCLDPMFPHRTKSALVKKEMRVCRRVAGDDSDADELFLAAESATRGRVVVKRALRAPVIVREPAFSYKGKTVRYDVYPQVAAQS